MLHLFAASRENMCMMYELWAYVLFFIHVSLLLFLFSIKRFTLN